MLKVLIAEDNIIKQKNIKKMLKENGIDYKLVETYSDCWKTIYYEYDEFDALILDMSLPRFKNEEPYKFAGYDILKHLYYKNINLPVIILTGHVQFRVDNNIYDLESLTNLIKENDRITNSDIVKYDNKSKAWQHKIINFIKSRKIE
ncbi:response regulator [Aliarcobacter butzleri]|uniref:response regulator n=1 Tax=Aliarcobacter butzleri TaxID=28197 RepID=UPI002B246ED4|nr:response regulator [Aliarcobacter butzleri]